MYVRLGLDHGERVLFQKAHVPVQNTTLQFRRGNLAVVGMAISCGESSVYLSFPTTNIVEHYRDVVDPVVVDPDGSGYWV